MRFPSLCSGFVAPGALLRTQVVQSQRMRETPGSVGRRCSFGPDASDQEVMMFQDLADLPVTARQALRAAILASRGDAVLRIRSASSLSR